MSNAAEQVSSVIPAQLAFLAIYNPSLGRTDETLQDQIVYYSSRKTKSKHRHQKGSEGAGGSETAEKNERLRQVGLAQGMVEFAKWAEIALKALIQNLISM